MILSKKVNLKNIFGKAEIPFSVPYINRAQPVLSKLYTFVWQVKMSIQRNHIEF